MYLLPTTKVGLATTLVATINSPRPLQLGSWVWVGSLPRTEWLPHYLCRFLFGWWAHPLFCPHPAGSRTSSQSLPATWCPIPCNSSGSACLQKNPHLFKALQDLLTIIILKDCEGGDPVSAPGKRSDVPLVAVVKSVKCSPDLEVAVRPCVWCGVISLNKNIHTSSHHNQCSHYYLLM